MNYFSEEDRKVLEYFFAFCETYLQLTDEEKAFFEEHITIQRVEKGKFLLKAGEICTNYYLIQRGVLRSFIKHGRKEITTWINEENELTTSIPGMIERLPSEEYIQALEPTTLICLSYNSVEQLYQKFPYYNHYVRLLVQQYYAINFHHNIINKIPNALDRYRRFAEQRPGLMNRIPLKYIASYLGMTVETLVRLRKKDMLGKKKAAI